MHWFVLWFEYTQGVSFSGEFGDERDNYASWGKIHLGIFETMDIKTKRRATIAFANATV